MIRKICKKATVWLLAGVIGLSAVTVQAAEVDNGASYPITTNAIEGWPQGPDTYSETAVLMDADTGTILYNKGMDEKRYPASITKIMTALLALENSNLDDQVTFTEECLADQTSDSGNIGMQVGEVLTMRQCLLALMIRSANDVATQIAVQIAGSVAAFADMMNQKAQELGCVNTHFVNASGMPDENHYTTAHDMALIFREAIKNQDFLDIIGTQSFTIDPTNMNPESRTYSTHHALVAQGAPEYYEGCFGGKTGVTEASKNTLVSGATRDGMTLIAVAMRADAGQVCQDHISMFDYGFNNFSRTAVKDLPSKITRHLLPAEKYILKDYKDNMLFETRRTASVSLPSGVDSNALEKTYSITKNPAGLPLLTVTYTYNDHVVGSARYYQTRLLSDQLL